LMKKFRNVDHREEQGFEPWEDFHPRRFSRPNSGAS
jgi:hypothetical protein